MIYEYGAVAGAKLEFIAKKTHFCFVHHKSHTTLDRTQGTAVGTPLMIAWTTARQEREIIWRAEREATCLEEEIARRHHVLTK
jgi:hypothetical protein